MLALVMSGVATSILAVVSSYRSSISSALPLLATVFILASLGFRAPERDLL